VPELRHLGWSVFSETVMQGLTGHTHPGAYEFCYIVRGNATWWVGAEVFEVEPGDIFLTWPDETHGGVDGAMHPCELYWLQLVIPADGSSLGLSAAETAVLHAAFRDLPYRKCAGDKQIADHYERLMGEHRHPTPLSQAMIRASLRLLCQDILAAFAKRSESGGGQRQYSPRIGDAIEWLNANLSRPISIEDAADAVGVRPSHFRDQFRRETGFSPVEYLVRLRVREAKQRLLETDASITEIAYGLGFRSSQYFATVFRRHTGHSPRDFRRRR